MNLENLTTVHSLASQYDVTITFFEVLDELGLIEVITVNENHYIHHDNIFKVEKIIRIHKDLELNLEGIDVVLNLLDKIETLQQELIATKNSLRLHY